MNANHAKKSHSIYTRVRSHIYMCMYIYMYVYEKCIQLAMLDFFVFGGGDFL